MAEMCAAPSASHFYATHAVAKIFVLIETVGQGLPKAGPAAAGVEFAFGSKQRLAATDAMVGSAGCTISVFAGKRRFCAFFPANVKLFRSEIVAPLLFAILLIGHNLLGRNGNNQLLYVVELFLYNRH